MSEHMQEKKPLSDERRYQYLITGINDYAIYMLDPQGHVSSWNAGANRFKGYVAHEILGQHFSRFYTDEDRADGLPERALQTALSEGKYESEGWRVRKDGTRFWAHVVLDPIYNEDGILLGFAKVTRDVTERKAAEDKLRESEQRFRLLVQGVTDYAIYMLSPVIARTRSSAATSRASTPPKTRPPACPSAPCRRQAPPAASRPKAGACARTAPVSGPTSSSTRFTTTKAGWSASPRSRAT
jgi:PAS domain S-box-containing protein